MNEEQIVEKVSMIDRWKVSGDSYTQEDLDAIGGLLDLYYDKQKEIDKLKARIINISEVCCEELGWNNE